MKAVLVKEDSESWVRFGNVDGWLCRECPARSDRRHAEGTFVLGSLVSLSIPSFRAAQFNHLLGSSLALQHLSTTDWPQSFNSCPSVHIRPSWGLVLWGAFLGSSARSELLCCSTGMWLVDLERELCFCTRLLEIMGPRTWKAQGGLSKHLGTNNRNILGTRACPSIVPDNDLWSQYIMWDLRFIFPVVIVSFLPFRISGLSYWQITVVTSGCFSSRRRYFWASPSL